MQGFFVVLVEEGLDGELLVYERLSKVIVPSLTDTIDIFTYIYVYIYVCLYIYV